LINNWGLGLLPQVAKRDYYHFDDLQLRMAIDQRDHYVEQLRDKTGYTEKSNFRISFADRLRQKKAASIKRPSWFWFWFIFAFVGVFLIVKIALLLLKI
jgi:hypothetical protein